MDRHATYNREQFLLSKQFAASFGVRLPRETTSCILVRNHLVQLLRPLLQDRRWKLAASGYWYYWLRDDDALLTLNFQ